MFKHPMGKQHPTPTHSGRRIPPEVVVAFSVLLTTAAMVGSGDADLGPATAGTQSTLSAASPFSRIGNALGTDKGG